jgi:hypothetical protein
VSNFSDPLAAVIEAHLWHHRANQRCICGWNADPYVAGDPVEQYTSHVADQIRAHLGQFPAAMAEHLGIDT